MSPLHGGVQGLKVRLQFFLGEAEASEKECSKRKGILSSCGECD